MLCLIDFVSSAADMTTATVGGRPRVPVDPDEQVPVDALFITGRAPWMPAEWAGRQRVEMSSLRATINPAGMDTSTREIPLHDLRILRAWARHHSRRPKHPTAAWIFALTDGQHLLTLTGSWLSIAWLGHLAHWPEP
jgi:hypothetical protein